MLEINMRPSGINWETEDVVLVTSAHMVHTSTGDSFKISPCTYAELRNVIKANAPHELSKNFIISEMEYHVAGYDVNIVNKDDENESYVSIVGMKSDGFNTLNAFKKTYGLLPIEESEKKWGWRGHSVCDINTPFFNFEGDGTLKQQRYNIATEVRVYRDKKVGVLFKIEYLVTKHVRYFMLKFSSFAGCKYWLVRDDAVMDEETYFNPEKNPDVIEIFNENEVHKHAFYNAKSASAVCKAMGFNILGNDLKNDHMLGWTASFYGGHYEFDKVTRDEVNTLMGVFQYDQAPCRELFDDKYDVADGCIRSTSLGITNINFLDKWTLCKAKTAASIKKKESDIKSLWRTIKWGTTTEKNPRAIVWERRNYITTGEEYIIASYYSSERCYNNKFAFIYNVKRRTRKVLVEERGEPKELIPSLKQCILRNFSMAPLMEYDRTTKTSRALDDGPTQTIVGGLSIKELFAGTNVAWILDNAAEFKDDLFYLFREREDYWYGDPKIHTVTEDIKEGGKIGVVALCILATTGNAMMEQLLKSRMFRMYFLALACEADNDITFWDTSKTTRRRYDHCPFPYTSKGKNLKEMFGMSLQQLRMADQAIEVKKKDKDSSGSNFYYVIPKFGNVAKVLGVEKLNALDDETFKEIIEMTKMNVASHYYSYYSYSNARGNTIFTYIGETKHCILEYMQHNTPKERLKIIKNFTDIEDADVFEDYLNMRKTMTTIQAKHPTEDIFDAKEYPAKVGKAVKFIRFMPGMKSSNTWYEDGRYYNGEINDQNTFVKYIKHVYAKYATEKGSVQLEVNEKGDIVGAIVKMNIIQHMNFLHDEMSLWYALYDDDSQVEEFKEATKRVEKYEWEDEETGLCIIKPKDPADLRKEGLTLSHCVASYVGPIIAGSHNIMFIRRNDMKDEPYYTLDINEVGEVTEVHGYSNCNMETSDMDEALAETGREVYKKHFDIKGFLRNWVKAMKGKVKEKSLRGTYSKLDVVA